MRFKILAVLVIFIFCIYDLAYSHSGRTNSAGCHNVTATGGYHCHGGSSSSGSGSYTRSSRYSEDDNDIYLVLGLAVIVVGVGYWAYTTDWGKNPQGCGCFLSQSLYDRVSTRNLFNRVSMQIPAPVSGFKLPVLNLDRQGLSGWQLRAAYTFRF